MKYTEITADEKKNIPFSCTPFCIETNRILQPDFVHIHDYHQLTVVTRGSAILMVNNRESEVTEGSVYIIGSYTPHYLSHTSHIEVTNILFRLDDLMSHALSLQLNEGFRSLFLFQASLDSDQRPTNVLRLNYEGVQHVLRLTTWMQEEIQENRPGRDIMIQSYFMELITILSRRYNEVTGDEPDSFAFGRLVEYIHSHSSDALSMEDFERISGLSEHQIRSMFKKKYETTPMQFLMKDRLEAAKRYLSTTSLSITEISSVTGFDDSNYFTRKFKQELGMSPRSYRQSLFEKE